MIKIGCLLNVKDNTGINKIKFIGTFKKRKKSMRIGDILIGSVKKTSNILFKKSEIVLAILIKTKQPHLRKDGTTIKFFDNGVIIIDKNFIPKGTHIFDPVPFEIKLKYKKIASLSNNFV